MSKISSLSCSMTAMLALISGMAIGADNAEAQPPEPEVAAPQQPPSNSQPKEEAAKPSEKSSTASNEEPSCD